MPVAILPNAQVESIYREHHYWLQSWLRKRLGCTAHAADIAHDTFVRLLGRDTAIREPRALLTTIAQGMVANFYRRRDIERAYEEALAAWPEPTVMSPEERAIVIETLLQIDSALNPLPAPVRQAFMMSQVEGMALGEIADSLGVSLATAKRYIAKALLLCCFGE